VGRVKDLDVALDIARHVLPAYERLLDVPYALPKLDLVAIPDFAAGAMENWGLLLYRETALLANENTSSISTLRDVAATVAHEMAHLVRAPKHAHQHFAQSSGVVGWDGPAAGQAVLLS
jgi:aminopeptidase N